MNEKAVIQCDQMRNILRLVKNNFKGLGRGKINLDTLCGNTYYRRDLTAIKYI